MAAAFPLHLLLMPLPLLLRRRRLLLLLLLLLLQLLLPGGRWKCTRCCCSIGTTTFRVSRARPALRATVVLSSAVSVVSASCDFSPRWWRR